MDSETTTPTKDKQVTVAVPEDRVPQFYAFYARFLAAGEHDRRGPWGRRGHRGHHGHCGHHHHHEDEAQVTGTPAPGAPAA